MKLGKTYNARLFEKPGIRSFFHNARFSWVKKAMIEYGCTPVSVFELGCFDGRLIEFLPATLEKYQGFDADWEGGLSSISERLFMDNVNFRKSESYADFDEFKDGEFSVSVALETIEHLPPEDVSLYLAQLSRITKDRCFITVPNEKGIVFLVKHIAKAAFYGGTQNYTVPEVLNATFCRIDRVKRDDHKGFDYAALVDEMSTWFAIERVEPIPWPWLPVSLGFTIGIIARKRQDGL